MKLYYKQVFFFSICAILVACSNYNQIVKGDDYDEKFVVANELFDDEK